MLLITFGNNNKKNIEKEIIIIIEKKGVIKKDTMGKLLLTLFYDGT
jgi:hypothetical protein